MNNRRNLIVGAAKFMLQIAAKCLKHLNYLFSKLSFAVASISLIRFS